MRKVSAHYYLRPDGEFIKRPIISIDNGEIIEIRELGDHFKEEPSLEYFPGIIIPAFVAGVKLPIISNIISKAKANGVLRVKESEIFNSELSVWHDLLSSRHEINNKESLSRYLMANTLQSARLLDEDLWGAIKLGARPGLLVLQNINLQTFTLTPTSKFKIIEP